jgi:O-antigen/teichoic acid export membrane protein
VIQVPPNTATGRLSGTAAAVLARNAVWNVAGSGLPMLVGLISIPILIRAMGTNRFGILTLAWALIGYTSLFDLGLGRALTKVVAEKVGTSDRGQIPELFWGSMFLLAGLALLAAALIVGLTPWLVQTLHMPSSLHDEARGCFYLLGICTPFVIVAAGLRGMLEALQRFDLVNAVRIPSGAFMYAGPLLVLPFSHGLPAVVAVLVLGRAAVCLVQLVLCFRVMPDLRRVVRPRARVLRPLVHMGSWLTLSNIISPIMANLDRFIIGVMLSVGAAAFYVVPCEVITRLLVLPIAIVAVLFPAFSASFAADPRRTARLFGSSLKYVFLILFPVLLVALVFAREGLTLWLGPTFAANSFQVLQWLAVGALLNGLAMIPLTLIQGIGRADLAAKLHVLELPFYLFAAYFLIHWYGLVGAAMAWTARVAFDAAGLFALSAGLLGRRGWSFARSGAFILGGVAILGIGGAMIHLPAKGLWLFAGLCYLAIAVRFFAIDPDGSLAAQNQASVKL